ncbi:hypothetical protein GCM10010302_40960 [Streptomyces polychromogenes]|uniref:Polyketide synthase n=1 Tax=Streptomyces polychromogenes TaxID=67342 RepID=A0ABP3F379_9ACTN
MAETAENTSGSLPSAHPLPYTLSGATEQALRAQALRLRTRLDGDAAHAAGPAGPGRALAGTRRAFEHRAVVVAADRDELARGLDALARGRRAAELVRGRAAREGGLAVLFSGQGSQRPGMGRGLYEAFPVFAAAFDEVCAELGEGLKEVVFGDDAGTLNRTGTAQRALFAVEVALYRLVESWGVTPRFVGGHSVGEVAAAHVCGVLSLRDAAVLVTARGRLMEALPGDGVMVSVQASAEQVAPLLVPGTAIAAVNGPEAVVVSGAREAVCGVIAELAARDVKSKALRVSHAFHSPLMDPMLEEFRAAVRGLDFRRPAIPFVSTLTGGLVTDEVARPGYWVRHVREAVRLQDAVRTLEAEGATTYLELGPDGLLTAMVRACLADADAAVLVPALRRQGDEVRALLTATAGLYVHGALAELPLGLPAGPATPGLPAYAVRRERHRPDRAGVQRPPAPAEPAPHREGAARLFAFPSLDAASGPHEYPALARALAGRRGLTVLAHPGFPGEAAAPRARQALVRARAEDVVEAADAAGQRRPVLLGHSSGGWIAHAVARELIEIGREAAAVVLLDTYARTGGRHAPAVLTERPLAPDAPPGTADYARSPGVGGHLRLFADWTPEPAVAPTLLVRASASAASAAAGWEHADHVVEVPGDHFSLLGADAGAVAAAVDGWLRAVAR